MKIKHFLNSLCFLFFFLLATQVWAIETPVRCQGDRVEYLRDKKIIRAEGNVVITKDGTTLTSDRAVVFIDSGDAYADGHVVLRYENNTFTADKMHYNFKTGLGDLVQTHFVGQNWFSQGETGRKVADQAFTLQDAYITTCDLQDPHYKIKGQEIRIYPDDRVVIHNPVVYLWDIPILWIPRYTFPLDDERSRFSIAPGYRSNFGAFLQTAYSFYQTDNIKGNFLLDYFTDRGVGAGADVQYKYKNETLGQILTYVIDDRAYDPTGVNEGDERDSTRYRFNWENQQQISYDTRLISEFNIQSDKDIVRDYFRSEFRNENQPENFVDITKSTPDYQITLFVSTQIDDVFNVLERLPELRLTTRKQRIQDTPIFYRSEQRIGYLNFNPGDDQNKELPVDEQLVDFDSFRYDTFHEFSYPKKYLGWLSFEPRFGFRVTTYSADEDGDSTTRGLYNAGFDLFTKISKTWDDVQDEFWDVNKLRHVIEPAVQYSIVGHPSARPDELLQFDSIDSIDRVNQFRLSLRNRLQTQRDGETINIINFEVFAFLFPSHTDIDEQSQAFSDVFLDFEALPISWLKFDIQARIDTEDTSDGIEAINTDLVYYYDDIFALTFAQRFLKRGSNLFIVELDYQINQDWQAKIFQRIEAQSGDLQDSEFALIRDFHDWKGVFSYRHREFRDEDTFFVLFYLKDFPDIPLKVGN